MGQFSQNTGGMPRHRQQWQQVPELMGSLGYGQPNPGLFSGGGAPATQSASGQPRPAPKESTFDFVGVGHLSQACLMIICYIDPYMPMVVPSSLETWLPTSLSWP